MLFCIGVSIFKKKSLIKDSIYRVKNNISLYIVHKVITITLIPNEYHQFRMWHKFISMNFTKEKHIGSIVKDTEVWYFEFVTWDI